MAHMIRMNELAYKGAKPWHGLGFEVPENATGAEMLKIAGLNWLVESRLMGMQATAYEKGKDGGPFSLPVPDNFRAIVRQDTNEVFQMASNIWKPVQNAEIVEFFREYCEAGHATMETVGGLRDGAIVWALARLNGASDTKIGRGEGKADEVRGYMLLATAHDGSIATTGIPTQTRVVCWNTLRAALDIGAFGKQGKKQPTEFRMIHTAKFDEAKWQEARQTMGMAIEQIAQVNEVANELAKVKIDAEGRLQFVEKLLLSKGDLLETVISDQRPSGSALDAAISQTQGLTKEAREKRIGFVGRAILEAMLNSPGADFASSKDTMWGALNGVTFYADHASKTFSESNRMYNSWFGKNDNLKSDALNLAIEMSGIRVGQA